ncbi:MAG: hypothetical protein E2O84_03950 [Bacteroidetes bacterium]|nr:MAG: hypothetical protein E2O84_03950 [Bacteroidota bacterium]
MHQASDSAIVSRAHLPGPVFAARSDTIDAGHLFVTNLPDSIKGFPVYEYSARSLPLRSWLLNKSFFWKTTEQDRGDHALTFFVFLEPKSVDANSNPADSIIVHLHIR